MLLGIVLSTATASAQQPATGTRDAHWALQPVRRPAMPVAAATHPIDAFVQAELAGHGLTPSRQADPATRIRRLYLVMLGVPPTPNDVAEFVAADSPESYERLVDRVLADPRYGERWARHWLDVARFAESNGFETNRERPNAWRYRDYVIGAFNGDLPYDQFVREQLAGDALGADVATGFLVAGPVDIVGSPDPVLTAQQRANELDDMVATTGTAFLGLTIGCARCHSHKFDPISHREYYAVSAMFAGVKHGERALPRSPQVAKEIAQIDARIAAIEQQLKPHRLLPAPMVATPTRQPVEFARNEEHFGPITTRTLRFTIFATSGGEPCIDELEVWAADRNVALGTEGTVATASGTLRGYDIHKLAHVHDGEVGNSHSWISDEVGGGWLQLDFAKPERIDRVVWGRDRDGVVRDRLAVQYQVDCATESGDWQVLASSSDRQPFGGASVEYSGSLYRFEQLPNAKANELRVKVAERQALHVQREARAQAPMAYAGTFLQPGPTHLLRRGDATQPAEQVLPGTLSLFRAIELAANTPEQQRRLQLANWITDPLHPTTARVLVNRVWQHQFGTGLVSTPSDFGQNGARPSHPDLLDWLASEFVAGGYSIKALQRLILTSSTWQQASVPRAEAMRVDADSRLLWRFPPRRLESEAIRDSMLAVTGELDPRSGGPGFLLHEVDRENVYHYHPKEEFGPAEARRMIYAFKVRMEQDSVFGAFDCPDGSLVMPKRGLSTTPLQSLNLWNNSFPLQRAEALAQRLLREAGGDVAAQVKRAWQLVYQRAPDHGELLDAVQFVTAAGTTALCRALLNSNEFLFIP